MLTKELLSSLEEYAPIHSYVFGHTPLQMEYFKVSAQQGDEHFEYWHQVLQLKSLYSSLRELEIQKEEKTFELKDARSWWPFWSRRNRCQKIPRLKFELEKIEQNLAEKTREASFHLDLLKTKYSHLEHLSEQEILAKDRDYWARRLSRQLAVSHLSRVLGVGEGELGAVLSLPKEQQGEVLRSMLSLVESSKSLLPNKTGA